MSNKYKPQESGWRNKRCSVDTGTKHVNMWNGIIRKGLVTKEKVILDLILFLKFCYCYVPGSKKQRSAKHRV